MLRKYSSFLVSCLSNMLGITPREDFNYLTLHIKDPAIHNTMRNYRATRFD